MPVPAIPESSPASDWYSITCRIRDGDASALERLYLHSFELVLREVRIVTGCDESTALDLLQDTFLNILRRMRPIADEQHLRAWIKTVARTTCYDWLRRRSRELRHLAAMGDSSVNGQGVEPAARADALEEFAAIEARYLLLQQHLNDLPAELKEMMSLRYRFGWTLARIANRFGKKTGAVDGQIRRALESIRHQLKGHFDDDE